MVKEIQQTTIMRYTWCKAVMWCGTKNGSTDGSGCGRVAQDDEEVTQKLIDVARVSVRYARHIECKGEADARCW